MLTIDVTIINDVGAPTIKHKQLCSDNNHAKMKAVYDFAKLLSLSAMDMLVLGECAAQGVYDYYEEDEDVQS